MLEAERYRYQAALSDLSNSDIAVHNNEPREVVSQVRNWLNNEAGLHAPGPSHVWGEFLDFKTDNFEMLKQRRRTMNGVNRYARLNWSLCSWWQANSEVHENGGMADEQGRRANGAVEAESLCDLGRREAISVRQTSTEGR